MVTENIHAKKPGEMTEAQAREEADRLLDELQLSLDRSVFVREQIEDLKIKIDNNIRQTQERIANL